MRGVTAMFTSKSTTGVFVGVTNPPTKGSAKATARDLADAPRNLRPGATIAIR